MEARKKDYEIHQNGFLSFQILSFVRRPPAPPVPAGATPQVDGRGNRGPLTLILSRQVPYRCVPPGYGIADHLHAVQVSGVTLAQQRESFLRF